MDSGTLTISHIPALSAASTRSGGAISLVIGTGSIPASDPAPQPSGFHFYVPIGEADPGDLGPGWNCSPVPLESSLEVLRIDREGSIGVVGRYTASDPEMYRALVAFFAQVECTFYGESVGRRIRFDADFRGAVRFRPGRGSPHGMIHLSVTGEEVPYLTIGSEGMFYSRGRLLQSDQEVYQALRSWTDVLVMRLQVNTEQLKG